MLLSKAGRWQPLSVVPGTAEGGCGFKRHGTYPRVWPRGCLVARYYCPAARRTLSLLPDCLAARRRGSLERVEGEALGVERAGSLVSAAAVQRPEIELPGALRWLARARRQVRAGLAAVRVIAPERFAHVELTIEGFAAALGLLADDAGVLRTLRALVPEHLGAVPAPLGFDLRRASGRRRRTARQHDAGADRAPGGEEARTLIPTDADPPP